MYTRGPNTIKGRLKWSIRKKVSHKPNARNVLLPSEWPGNERVLWVPVIGCLAAGRYRHKEAC